MKAIVSRLVRSPRFWAAGLLVALLAAGIVLISPHVQAWYHLRAARWELQHWHNAQAIDHLKVCLRVWPRDPDVLLLAARSRRRARGYGEAERLVEMYQEVRGLDDACTLEQLLLSAERYVDQVAETCWHHVEHDHPDKQLILEALVRGYLRRYRIGDALACLQRWKQIDPDNAQMYCLEGLLYLDYTHTQSPAINGFRRAVELDADHEEARQGLAVALISARRYSEAIEHLHILLRHQPESPGLRIGLAECYDGLGQDAEAMKLVDAVLAQQPEFPPAVSLRGQLYMKSGDSVQAERWLREAVRLNPTEHRARYSLILCLNQNGKEEESRKLRQHFEQLEDDLARFNDIVTKDILQRPNDPALHCTLGQLLLRGGQREEGLRWLQSALRLDPNYAPARQAVEEYQKQAQAEAQRSDSGR